jgi:hypothetical protein
MRKRAATWALTATLFGCAGLGPARARETYLRQQLDDLEYAKPIGEVWPDVLRLLAERGYSLVGRDREKAGLPEQGFLGRLVSAGFETQQLGEEGRAVETDWDRHRLRYRVEGRCAGGRCRIEFTSIKQDEMDPARDQRWRDREMELDLLRRVDPEAAARIEAGAEEVAKPGS